MTDLLTFLSSPQSQLNFTTIPNNLTTIAMTDVHLLFSPSSILISIQNENNFRKLVILQNHQISSLGVIAFLCCLQLDLISSKQLIRFVTHELSVQQIIAQIIQFLDRFILNFKGLELFSILTTLAEVGFGKQCCHYLLLDTENIVYDIIKNKNYQFLTVDIFRNFIKHFEMQSSNSLEILSILQTYNNFQQQHQDILEFCISNTIQFLDGKLLNQIENSIEHLELRKISFTQILGFVKINQEILLGSFYVLLFKNLLGMNTKYYKYMWKFVSSHPGFNCDKDLLYEFILNFLKRVDTFSAKHYTTLELFLYQNLNILNLENMVCVNDQIYQLLLQLKCVQDSMNVDNINFKIYKNKVNMNSIIQQVIWVRQKSIKLIDRLSLLHNINSSISHFYIDSYILDCLKLIQSSDGPIIKFPQISFKILQLIISIKDKDYQQSLVGFQRTTSQQTLILYESYFTNNYNFDVFDISLSQLYILDAIQVISLVIEDYNNIQPFSLGFIFTPQNIYICSELENTLTSLILQLNTLMNILIQGDQEQIQQFCIFSFQLKDSIIDSKKKCVILPVFQAVLKQALFYYLFLENLDNTIISRYFDQLFQQALIYAYYSNDLQHILYLNKNDKNDNSAMLISSIILKEQIFPYLSLEQQDIYQSFKDTQFYNEIDLQYIQNIILTMNQSDMRLKQFIVLKLIHYQKFNQFQLQQILFQSQNFYVDKIVSVQYLLKILSIILDVKQNFQHINQLSQLVNDLYHIIFEASTKRNYVLQLNFYQNQKVQLQKTVAYKEYFSFLTEYLLKNIQFPTHNLVSLSTISKYLNNLQIIDRTRIINGELFNQLQRFHRLKITYQTNHMQKVKTKIDAQNISEYFYLILEKIITSQQQKTQGQIYSSIFDLIQPHFLVDLQLTISMLVFTLQKIFLDQGEKYLFSEILSQISLQILYYLRGQSNQNMFIQSSVITSEYAEYYINILLQANINIKYLFVSNEDRIIINQDLQSYSQANYQSYINLIDFYLFGQQYELAYEQFIFILHHNHIHNCILSIDQRFKSLLIKLLQRNTQVVLVEQQLVAYYPYKQQLSINLEKQLERINVIYGFQEETQSKNLGKKEYAHLLKVYYTNKISLSKLQNQHFQSQLNLNRILMSQPQQSQGILKQQGIQSIFLQNLDDSSEFSILNDESLQTIFNNLYDLIQDNQSQIFLLNKIIPIYIKLKTQAQKQENSKLLQLEIILRTHHIILQIFNEKNSLITQYYKIFFIIWIEGCQLQQSFTQQNNQQQELQQSIRDYLTLQEQGTQTTFLSQYLANQTLIIDFINQLSPYQILEQFVYIFNGYQQLTSKALTNCEGLLEVIIKNSIWHYAHFDLFLRQVGIYFVSKTQKKFTTNDLVAQVIFKILKSFQQSKGYTDIVSKYIQYSVNYSSFIEELIQIRDKMEQRKHLLHKKICFSSFKFLNCSKQIIVSQNNTNIDDYEILLEQFYIKSFQYQKTYNSKAKPVLFNVQLNFTEEQLILKPDDFTGTDNCLMEYLDNLNQFMSFSSFRFKIYYVGQVYCAGNNKFSLVEVLQKLQSIQSLINTYPKIQYRQPFPQHSEVYLKEQMQKQLTLSQIRFSLFDSGSVGQQQDNNYKTIDSIACWSVICFLLGIGDRHNNNILFDPVTQTIHNIDFEAIFYHAKDLPIPDACDIRLTPFIIHLLGPARFESRFKQTSQNLLRIIQQNSHMFLTSFTAVSTMLSKNKTDIVMKIFENICSNIEEQYWVSINRSIDEIRLGQMFPPWAPLE